MLVNPGIQEWFDRLQGRPLGGGGYARGGGLSPNFGTAAAEGIIEPRRGVFGFNAPPIYPGSPPPGSAPNPSLPAPSGSYLPFEGIHSGGRDLGGAAKAAGLKELGAGIESAMRAIGQKNRQRQADLAAANALKLNAPSAFGAPQAPPSRPGEPLPPPRPGEASALSGPGSNAPLPPPRPDESVPPPRPDLSTPSFAPVGVESNVPIFAQPDQGAETPLPSIGQPAALPTFSQGAPGAGDTTAALSGAPNIAAFRYNNPGNVSLPIAGWQGGGDIVGLKNQPGYARFPDMQTGMDAFKHRVTNYIDSRGLNTIQALNSSYATDPTWAAKVSQFSGIGRNTPLDTSNAEQMSALQKGILTQEMGAANANRVLGNLSSPQPSTPSASTYAATMPASTGTSGSQLAGPAPRSDYTEPRLVSPGQPQTGPAYSDETWNNRPIYDYQGGAPSIQAPAPTAPVAPTEGGAASVPVPPPPEPIGPSFNDQGSYSVPGQQGMFDQGQGLAAALAQGEGMVPPAIDPSYLATALANWGPPPADFAAPAFPDFGGGFFGGIFG